jgi:hypothetical protein
MLIQTCPLTVSRIIPVHASYTSSRQLWTKWIKISKWIKPSSEPTAAAMQKKSSPPPKFIPPPLGNEHLVSSEENRLPGWKTMSWGGGNDGKLGHGDLVCLLPIVARTMSNFATIEHTVTIC